MSDTTPETTPAAAPEVSATTAAPEEDKKETTSIFGSKAGETSNIFSAAPAFGAAPAATTSSTSEDVDAGADDKHAADFAPLISLPKVEVRTEEEDEEVMYKCRCKLFVFVKEDVYGGEKRENFWKERGTGEVKLLKHKEFGKVRLLMRQEKTLKICANHLVSPHLELKPNVGSDRSWVFSANDFADEELKAEMFAMKFGKSEFANEFKEKCEEAKKINADRTQAAATTTEAASDDKKEEATEKEEAGEGDKLADDVEKLKVEGEEK